MTGLHHLLTRQLHRLRLTPEVPPRGAAWEQLLARVDVAYRDADRTRELLQRTQRIANREFNERHDQVVTTAESLLAIERARAQAVFDHTATGLLMIDEHGAVTAANPEATRLLGPSAQLLGRRLGEVVLIDDSDHGRRPLLSSDALDRVLDGGHWAVADLQLVGVAGHTVPVDVSITAVRHDDEVVGGLVVLIDDSEREAARARIAWQASHDPLTGLPNRALLSERLALALSMAADTELWPAVLFVDIDRFKQINDTLGHSFGDQVLQTVAQRIRSSVGPSDVVARVGGDEFVVLCYGASSNGASAAVAERIRTAVNLPCDFDDGHTMVSVSIGIADAFSHTDTVDALLRDADLAMYAAKRRGRDRVEAIDEDARAHAAEQSMLRRGLRAAISEHQITVAYQPIRSLVNGELISFEALARWTHPTLGDIQPQRFIPLAEEAGLIGALGERVTDLAVRDAATWCRESGRAIGVHVNLSNRELMSATHRDMVTTALDEHGLPSKLLTLEVTEGVLIDEPERALEQLQALQRCGVQVAIDDFGTGYSSLSYLRRFPLHVVKIDREFIASIASITQNQRIVRAVVHLAHGMGYRVLAEGVETRAELETVRRLGCELVQGFLLGAPMPPTEALLMAVSHPVRREFAARPDEALIP